MLDRFIDDGTCSRRDLAVGNERHPADLGHLLPLAFPAPDIVDAIRIGRQPADLTAKHLRRSDDLPMNWAGQRHFLGFDAQIHLAALRAPAKA
jgi:site-specific DNA recombinase